ncbi:succinate dehydrogenase cytochrome b subunit [Actinomyces radicidentis]|uniref:succinate dehydrogenase cytochrome b subunit n=1 Tax=Actinomyces radicidentis TaxID=111015 RepID=UPI0026E0165E|nr:succinate dehydrogenase cytochrome b subunit [Actinomyces radicidentis]
MTHLRPSPQPPLTGDAPEPRRLRRRPPWARTPVLKTTAALTGLVMAAFVLIHMIGNLKAYQGPAAYDAYAAWLRGIGYPLLPHEGLLWALRIVLGACLVLHVAATLTIRARGRAARGPELRRGLARRGLAARSMTVTGLLVLVFIAVHLLDLTIGRLVAPSGFLGLTSGADGAVTAHAYANLVASLSRPPMAGFYLLVMAVLGVHLAHGLWTAVADLGVTGARTRRLLGALAAVVAAAVAIGDGILAVLVLAGAVS